MMQKGDTDRSESMTCEAEKRGYKKVKVTRNVLGWPVGSIVWLDENSRDKDECWNDDCTDHWFHKIGISIEYVKDTPMQLEVGKYYKTRDGRKVGPMRQYEVDDNTFDVSDDSDDSEHWGVDGLHGEGIYGHTPALDLIAEWPSEPEPPQILSTTTIDAIAKDSLKWHYATEMEPLEKEAFKIVMRYYGVSV